jgi:hypothetical protein
MTTPTEQSRAERTAKYLADESAASEALAMLPEAVRQRLDAWQTAQSEWFSGTVLEIVAEFIAWDDARRIEAKAVPVAVIGKDYRLLWASQDTLKAIVDRTGISVGSFLYATPQPDRVAELEAALREQTDECFDEACEMCSRHLHLLAAIEKART